MVQRLRMQLLACVLNAIVCVGAAYADPPAELKPCSHLQNEATVSNIVVSVRADFRQSLKNLSVEGVISLTSPAARSTLHYTGARDLCYAALGRVELDSKPICEAFEHRFNRGDSIETKSTREIKFKINGETQGTDDKYFVALVRPADNVSCAKQVTFQIAPAEGTRIRGASEFPDHFANDLVVWSPVDWQASTELAMEVLIERSGQATDSEMRGPRSWTSYLNKDTSEGLQTILKSALSILIIFAGFFFFARPLIFGEAVPTDAAFEGVRSAATLAVASGSMSAFLGARGLLSQITGRPGVGPPLQWSEVTSRESFFEFVQGMDYDTQRILIAGAFAVPTALALIALSHAIGGIKRENTNLRNAIAASVVCLRSACILSAFALALAVILLAKPAASLPFEIPAILLSAFFCVWVAVRLEKLSGLSRWQIVGISLAVALSVLYPVDPVVRSTGSAPSTAYNTVIWFNVIASVASHAVLLTVLLLIAIRLAARCSPINTPELSASLLFIFVLSLCLFSLSSAVNAIAFFVMFLVAKSFVFRKPSTDDLETQGTQAPDVKSVSLFAGLVGLLVLWLQLAAESPGDRAINLVLFGASVLFAAAVPAALGAILLSSCYQLLPGQRAVSKALVVAMVGFAASIAGQAQYLLVTKTVLPAAIDALGIMTALLTVAILFYDFPKARAQLGGGTLTERLSGSGLGWLVTLFSAASAAVLAALGPVISSTLGEALRLGLERTLDVFKASQGG